MDPLVVIFFVCLVIMLISLILLVGMLIFEIVDYMRERIN